MLRSDHENEANDSFIQEYLKEREKSLRMIKGDPQLRAALEAQLEKVIAIEKSICASLPAKLANHGRILNLVEAIAFSQLWWAEDDPDLSNLLVESGQGEMMIHTQQIEGYVRPLKGPLEGALIDGEEMLGVFLTEEPNSPYIALDPRLWVGLMDNDGRVNPFNTWSGRVEPLEGRRVGLEVTMAIGDFPPYLKAWNPDILHNPDLRLKS